MSSNSNAGLGLILADVGDVIEDQQVVFIEPGEGAFFVEANAPQTLLLLQSIRLGNILKMGPAHRRAYKNVRRNSAEGPFG
jgi:hypothetical protein